MNSGYIIKQLIKVWSDEYAVSMYQREPGCRRADSSDKETEADGKSRLASSCDSFDEDAGPGGKLRWAPRESGA